MAKPDETSTVGDRVKEIRELRGEDQPMFAASMTAMAAKLKLEAGPYDNTKVSKMETGVRRVQLVDVLVIAMLDPRGRDRDWLAWAESMIAAPRRQAKQTPSVPARKQA